MGCTQWIPAPQDELEKLPPARGKLKLYPSVHLRGEISRRSFLPGKQEVNKLAGVNDRRFCRRPSWRGLQPVAPPQRTFSESLSFCGAGIYCRHPRHFKRHARALEYPPTPHFSANSSLPLRRDDAGVFPSQPPYFVSPHPGKWRRLLRSRRANRRVGGRHVTTLYLDSCVPYHRSHGQKDEQSRFCTNFERRANRQGG